MNILLLGSKGQLGCEITSATHVHTLFTPSRHQCDLTQLSVNDFIDLLLQQHIDTVINAAALTAVDYAEQAVAETYASNAFAVATLARACERAKVRLIHISTDYVFNGLSALPYTVATLPDPINVYGASKALGESLLFQYNPSAVCLRTSWLYSEHGSNFVKTLLPLMQTLKPINIVNDQRGSPTWAANIAKVIWHLVEQKNIHGTLHWTDAGVCSWFEFATTLQQKALHKGILQQAGKLQPINSTDYGAIATRPAYSALNSERAEQLLGLIPQPWEKALEQMLEQMVLSDK